MAKAPVKSWDQIRPPIVKNSASADTQERKLDYTKKSSVTRGEVPVSPDPSIRVVVTDLGLQEVFDTWDRFSHSGANFPSNASELTAWSYDTGTQTISSTINSSTYIGFVSPIAYTNYTIESQITSTNADNDRIGIVIAYYKDVNGDYGPAGFEYTLSAIRNQDGLQDAQTDSWAIVYNYLTAGGDVIANGNSSIPYVGVSNWNLFPNGTTIRIARTGDIVKAYSTDPDSTELKGELIVDLNSDVRLEKFKGSSQVGLSCFSQGDCKFNGLELTYAETPNLGRFNEGDTINVNYQTFNVNDDFANYVITRDSDNSLASDITPPKGKILQTGTFENKSGSFVIAVDVDGETIDVGYTIKLISRDKTALATFSTGL